mmetsp:Transcript_71490/g.197413  ORF Transcript_71490/g.197413 Transcript_71490/m.197413 type:complete len:103 (+) Transcript_71490:1132-1440(+)
MRGVALLPQCPAPHLELEGPQRWPCGHVAKSPMSRHHMTRARWPGKLTRPLSTLPSQGCAHLRAQRSLPQSRGEGRRGLDSEGSLQHAGVRNHVGWQVPACV